MQRLLISFSLAVLAAAGTAGNAFADFNPTKDERSLGMLVVAGIAMFVLLCIYAVKWYFGLDEQPENPDLPDMSNASLPAGGAAHGHH
jgi:hypothetical protein